MCIRDSRYPDGKSNITGVNFENWHFRYVGVENAQYMANHQLVLEEDVYKRQPYYQHFSSNLFVAWSIDFLLWGCYV